MKRAEKQYCRILIHIYFHTVLSEKNKYQIHSYMTSNMDDFKTICIYENLLVFVYFFKKTGGFVSFL